MSAVEIGKRYGKLTILADAGMYRYPGGNGGRRLVVAKCDCGEKKTIRLDRIRAGKTVSCGCHRRAVHRAVCSDDYKRRRT